MSRFMARYRAVRRAPWWLRKAGPRGAVTLMPHIDPTAGGPVPARVQQKEPV